MKMFLQPAQGRPRIEICANETRLSSNLFTSNGPEPLALTDDTTEEVSE